MKSKGVMALALIGALSIGGVKTYAQVSKNTTPKNQVMTKKVVAQQDSKNKSKEDKLKQTALEAFQKNLGETVDVKNLYEMKNYFYNAGGKNFYVAQWCNGKDKAINDDDTIYYGAVIDTEANKIVKLEYISGKPKNENYKNFSYDKAKNLAVDFVKNNNILSGKSYELSEAESKEANCSEGAWNYHFYVKYDGGKTCLVDVSKDLQKVNQFILLDESGAEG
ncbi:hypothetical protein [Clostridium tetanomorphum]|uniref:Uncharacterized protein n=1 Tax=Clostridium tetanomorphum TaxID=1553 RepID=A0A923J201_CLOTT|nr:hypothetical protein [Clostridium tetanomorphum]MBC2399747.1 hypothetical protein [Clostridium tetanomorphum]NRZ96911.1 hypothetical protein [Clostridium tetanomorphum]